MSPSETLELITQDQTRIAAKLFKPQGAARAKLVVAGATGVPQGFYRAFADYAASRGFYTLSI